MAGESFESDQQDRHGGNRSISSCNPECYFFTEGNGYRFLPCDQHSQGRDFAFRRVGYLLGPSGKAEENIRPVIWTVYSISWFMFVWFKFIFEFRIQ